MEICDLWGSDNGFVFNWGVQFYGGVDVECELVPNDETPECNPQESLEEYGRLYNRHALDDSRGLCPLGWHTPEEAEWDIMFDHLGGLEVAGGKMRSTYGWEDEGNGTNVSGFSGLPGGYRGGSSFVDRGYNGAWWYTLEHFIVLGGYDGVDTHGNPQDGASVRCIQDSE